MLHPSLVAPDLVLILQRLLLASGGAGLHERQEFYYAAFRFRVRLLPYVISIAFELQEKITSVDVKRKAARRFPPTGEKFCAPRERGTTGFCLYGHGPDMHTQTPFE